MSKFTKYVLICCSTGLLIGGILFAIGIYFEGTSQQDEGIHKEVQVKDVLDKFNIEITTDGTNVLHNTTDNSEIAEVIDIEEAVENFENINVESRVASISG